ncbi:MAG TPA: hypothetical protein VHT21_09765, partial [Stellaceae bacterium]|nr:hypothetical protein [Stellaceae bacterium]
ARAAGRGQHHRGPEDLRLGGRLDDFRLPDDAFELWLAARDRRGYQGVYDILLLIKFQKVRPPEEAAVLSAP